MKYIYFCKAVRLRTEKPKKTSDWIVRKDSDKAWAERLGLVKFYPRWRQYVFYPDEETLWSSGCLKTITEFLDKVNKKWRESKKKKVKK